LMLAEGATHRRREMPGAPPRGYLALPARVARWAEHGQATALHAVVELMAGDAEERGELGQTELRRRARRPSRPRCRSSSTRQGGDRQRARRPRRAGRPRNRPAAVAAALASANDSPEQRR